MKYLIALFATSTSFIICSAQGSQFAVVRQDGTTYICPTWDSAYSKANNGDFIYLPGVTLSNQIHINKKLFIFGSGHHPDSSFVTGKTIFSSNLFIYAGASGGSIEGVQVLSSTIFNYGNKIQNYTIKRCYLTDILFSSYSSPIVDSLPEYIYVEESILNSSTGYGTKNIFFNKTIITNTINNFKNSTFKNNIFLRVNQAFSSTFQNTTNTLFENNIFLDYNPLEPNSGNCGNTHLNNLKYSNANFNGSTNCPVNLAQGNISTANISDIFILMPSPVFAYTNNYHLKPTCPGVNAGTDGTDVGIYGTIQPTSEGWVPSNPHIYFKQVAPQTNNSGQLQIQFRVRTNN